MRWHHNIQYRPRILRSLVLMVFGFLLTTLLWVSMPRGSFEPKKGELYTNDTQKNSLQVCK